jgi:hypothetical protein
MPGCCQDRSLQPGNFFILAAVMFGLEDLARTSTAKPPRGAIFRNSAATAVSQNPAFFLQIVKRQARTMSYGASFGGQLRSPHRDCGNNPRMGVHDGE